jgi:hypothetical protein
MRFSLIVFFHEPTPNRPLMNVKKKFYIFCEFVKIFMHEVSLSEYYPRKVKKLSLVILYIYIFSSKSRVALITHVEFLFKISYRSSDRPLKSGILTFCSIMKLSAGYFMESFDFPWIILQKGMSFRSMIRGKF